MLAQLLTFFRLHPRLLCIFFLYGSGNLDNIGATTTMNILLVATVAAFPVATYVLLIYLFALVLAPYEICYALYRKKYEIC
jgi:hypothetical protein